jgi:uncharacterized protein YeaO (DUF488 family)
MKPLITAYRYGSMRQPKEGIRIGAAHQVPLSVPREDWQQRNYFDLWVPLLAPTSDLVSQYRHDKISFASFGGHYKSQMKTAENRQVIELLAAIALVQSVSVGCLCEEESRCHQSILRELIHKEVKRKAVGFSRVLEHSQVHDLARFARPACFARDHE